MWHSPDAGKSWVRHRAPVSAEQPHPGPDRRPGRASRPPRGRRHRRVQRATTEGALPGRAPARRAPSPTVWSLAVDQRRSADALRRDAAGRHVSLTRRRRALGAPRAGATATDVQASGRRSSPRVLVDPDGLAHGVGRRGDRRRLPQRRRRRHLDPRRTAASPTSTCTTWPSRGSRPQRVLVSTNGEVFWSDDRGETWTPIGVKTRSGRCPTRAAWRSSPTTRASSSRGAARPPPVRPAASCARPTAASPLAEACRYPSGQTPCCGGWRRIRPTPPQRRGAGRSSARSTSREDGRRVLAEDPARVRRDPLRRVASGLSLHSIQVRGMGPTTATPAEEKT